MQDENIGAGWAAESIEWLVNAAPNLVGALFLLIIGWLVSGWIRRAVGRLAIANDQVDNTLAPVLAQVARYTVLIIVFVAVLGQLGVQTASVLAALGAAGLAVGLALQGTLSNIAAGIMLLWLRPFRVGDFIDAGDVSGTVDEIGLFATRLTTPDGIYRFAPNSEVWNKPILNFARAKTRRVEVEIGIGYGESIAQAREVLLGVANSLDLILADPAPRVDVTSLGDSAVVVRVRCWSLPENYFAALWQLNERSKTALDEAGIEIPFPQWVMHEAA